MFILETPSAPFLDLTVQSQSSVYANFSPPLTDGGSAIHSYKVRIFIVAIVGYFM